MSYTRLNVQQAPCGKCQTVPKYRLCRGLCDRCYYTDVLKPSGAVARATLRRKVVQTQRTAAVIAWRYGH